MQKEGNRWFCNKTLLCRALHFKRCKKRVSRPCPKLTDLACFGSVDQPVACRTTNFQEQHWLFSRCSRNTWLFSFSYLFQLRHNGSPQTLRYITTHTNELLNVDYSGDQSWIRQNRVCTFSPWIHRWRGVYPSTLDPLEESCPLLPLPHQ